VGYLEAVLEEVVFEMKKGGPSIVNYVVTYPVEDA
jgi:hypothetical protein